MSDTQDLNRRLEAVSEKIEQTRKKLKEHNKWHDMHHLAAGELEARFDFLKSELERQTIDVEAHGHHVTLLEESLLNWLNKVDI